MNRAPSAIGAGAPPTAEVVVFPVNRTRPSRERPQLPQRTRQGEPGIWIAGRAAAELERQLEDYQLLYSRAWDVSAIAATIGAATGATAEVCSEAARKIGEQLLAYLRKPAGSDDDEIPF
jgi:hypothetical protein